MKQTCALLVCGAALMAATPTFAQEYDDADPSLPDTPADVFSGPHFELSAGLDHLGIKSYKNLDDTSTISAHKTSVSYGGAFGYDTPLTEHLTIGLELGAYTASTAYNNPAPVTGNFNTARVRAGRDLSVGLRLGYAFDMKTQVFAKIAYTNVHFGVTGSDGSNVLYDGLTNGGARAGVGIEHHLTRSFYVKLEYDRSQYGSGIYNYNAATPDASDFDLRDSRDQLVASFGVRF